ncbi:hypothetical protein M2105_001886 [Paenibacillus sp. PastF-1]|nr:hypothetical protein [Paenibacillus sp. PastF-2]MDF9847381.1 hypothetical protein [Paenibacillus sp. PastM-2]MDF9854041.1 hypothetical protein [Paenibacillus sp. PastF-1]MDH6479314.1 hypothetical protein [Paenibacillus sp. PastH-2]
MMLANRSVQCAALLRGIEADNGPVRQRQW